MIKVFSNYKKHFSILGIILMLVPFVFLIRPQKAEAGIPVSIIADPDRWLWNYILKPIGWIMAKMMLRQITNSIVAWINSGFDGQPLFITDTRAFLNEMGDQASGYIMEKVLGTDIWNQLCGPWKIDLYLALYRTQPFDIKMQCTISDVIDNFNDFYADFQKGGWAAWITMTDNVQNNPYGAYLTTAAEIDAVRAAAKTDAMVEAEMNQGFLGMKKCTESYVDTECLFYATEEECTVCTKYIATTPGRAIGDQLSGSTGAMYNSLAVADEIDEILAAIAEQFLSALINAQSGGLGEYVPPTDDLLDAISIASDLEIATQDLKDQETEYLDAKTASQNNLNSAKTALNDAITCYNAKPTECATEINTASSTIASIDTQLTNINSDVTDSNNIIWDIDLLLMDIDAAETPDELQIAADNYQRIFGLIHTSEDIEDAESEETTTETTLNNANTERDECLAGTAPCLLP